jgi:uncharacterized protein YfiM (DUF2279 family)
MKKQLWLSLFIIISSLNCYSQSDSLSSPSILKKSIVFSGQIITYTGFTYEMSQQFFNTPHLSDFHLKQDLNTWRGMDKFFHAFGSYQFLALLYQTNKWTGMKDKRALNLAFWESTLFGTTKEYCDGRIDVGGWSWYDIEMNFTGNLFFYLQQRFLNKQLIQYKYSYGNSHLQHYYPETLGSSWKNYWFRDYNGQTFWVSVSLGNMNLTQNKWLKPIAFCLGYGADNLIYELSNKNIDLKRYSQLYLGLDIDLTQIETKNKFLKTTFLLLNRLRFPLPSIEYNSLNQFKFHPFIHH